MLYRVIRAGDNYKIVIAITPPDASPRDVEVECYQRNSSKIGDREVGIFYAITPIEAQLSVSGHTNGWGFERLPEQTFDSLDDINEWIEKHQKKAA